MSRAKIPPRTIPTREACRNRMAIAGADAQALENLLCITEAALRRAQVEAAGSATLHATPEELATLADLGGE